MPGHEPHAVFVWRRPLVRPRVVAEVGSMTGVPGVSPVQEWRQLRARLAVLANAASEAEAIDLLREAEQCKAALSAVQACQTAVLEALRHNAEALREVPASRRGKGLGAEVGLARMVSPARGADRKSVG